MDKSKKVINGKVISDKMDKTVVVEITSVKTHPLYRKKFITTNKIKAHDEKNEYKIGDIVDICSTRPMSRDKKFAVLRKVK